MEFVWFGKTSSPRARFGGVLGTWCRLGLVLGPSWPHLGPRWARLGLALGSSWIGVSLEAKPYKMHKLCGPNF